MPNLKDLRIRIDSVKSTQKITSAMKMVAAAKLRRAQEQAEAARPYSDRMDRMLASLAGGSSKRVGGPQLLSGTGKDDTHLIVVMSSDRGLCGGFNTNVVRAVRTRVSSLLDQGKTVKLLCVGRKGRDLLRRQFGDMVVGSMVDVGRRSLTFGDAQAIATRILSLFDEEEFDVCTIVFNKFQSAISQVVTEQQLIPFGVEAETNTDDGDDVAAAGADDDAVYEFEPDEEEILSDLLPRNIAVQVFRALLEGAASEHGARMTAMDNATRNAGEMIDDLTMTYNRTRQAVITKELIEIISGADAL